MIPDAVVTPPGNADTKAFDPSLEPLRESAFRWVRERLPGALNPAVRKDAPLAEFGLQIPAPDEQRYIANKVRQFAAAFSQAIPAEVRARAAYFEPPLDLPTEAEIINTPETVLRALESITPHLNLSRGDRPIYERLFEDIRYVVESSSRAVLGLGKDDATEYQHILRTLSSATRSSVRLLDFLEDKLADVPLPDPPPAELPDDNKPALDLEQVAKTGAAVKDFVQTVAGEALEALARGFRRVKATVAVKWEAVSRSLSHTGSYIKMWASRARDAIGFVGKGCVFGIIVATAPVWWPAGKGLQLGKALVGLAVEGIDRSHSAAKAGLAAAKALIVQKGGQWGGKALDAIEAFVTRHPVIAKTAWVAAAGGTAALLTAIYTKIGWGLPFGLSAQELIGGVSAVVAAGTAAMLGGGAVLSGAAAVTGTAYYGSKKYIYTPIREGIEDAAGAVQNTEWYYRLFAHGRSVRRTDSFAFLSSDVVSYFRRNPSRKDAACLISSQDRDFWDKVGVLDIHILDSKGGSTIQLDKFLDREARKPGLKDQIDELRRSIYRTRTFETPDLEPADIDETVISMKVRPGRNRILLPLGYGVTGIAFEDTAEKPLPEFKEPVEVEECALGSASLEIPVGVRRLNYRIRRAEFSVPAEQVERFKRLLPAIGTFKGIEGEAYTEALNEFSLSKADEMKLLFNHQADRGFKIVDDSFVRSFLATAGNAVAESVGGMRMGSTDALTYYSAAMLNANSVPSVLISGLVPHPETSTYPIGAGHSQTVVLTEHGGMVCDLADKSTSLDGLGSKSLLPRERFGMLRRLQGLNYHQVFDYSAEVREVLTSSKGKELGTFNSLANAFFGWTGFGVPFVRRSYRDPAANRSLKTDFDRLEVPPEENVVRVLSKKLALEQTIDYCRSQGTINQVHAFYKENKALPALRSADVALVPPQHADLGTYSVRQKVVDFTAESLRGGQFTASAKRASIEWIAARIPSRETVLDYAAEGEMSTTLNRFFFGSNSREILSPEELTRILHADAISGLTDSQAKTLIFGTLALPLAPVQEHGTGLYETAEVSAETIMDLIDRGTLLARQLAKTGIPFTKAEKEAVAILASHLGSMLIERCDRGNAAKDLEERMRNSIRECAETIALVTNLGRTKQVSFFYDLLMENRNALTRSLVGFAKRVGGDALFGSRGGRDEIDAHERSLGALVTKSFCERELGDQSLPNWWNTLEFFEALRLSPGKYADLPKIKRQLKRELAREARKGDIHIGYPDEVERPVSFLCSKLIDRHSVDRIRIGQTLEKHGLLLPGDLKEVWPDLSESKALALLTKAAQPLIKKAPDDLAFGSTDAPLSTPIAVAEVPTLAHAIIGDGPEALHAAVAYNQLRRGSRHWAEVAMRNFRDRFPREWELFVDKFRDIATGNLVTRVLRELHEGVTSREAYHALLAYAAEGVDRDNSLRVTDLLEGLRALDPAEGHRPAAAFDLTAPIFETCANMARPFSDVRPETQVTAALTASLLSELHDALKPRKENTFTRLLSYLPFSRTTQRIDSLLNDRPATRASLRETPDPHLDPRVRASKRFFSESLELDSRLTRTVEQRVPPNGSTPEASVWKELFRAEPRSTGRGWDLTSLARESRRKADMIQTRFREALPHFLYSRAGCVLVNAQSGDFRGYRAYAHGDSLRQIDWKRSVKDGNFSVRLRDEEEARSIRLIYDAELLVDAARRWLSQAPSTREIEENPLRELFVLCHLAARENVRVDVVLYGRSHLTTFEEVVRRSSQSPRGSFQIRRFLPALEQQLRGADELFRAEQPIYGNAGMEDIDIFGAQDLPVKPGQLHLFGMAPRNKPASLTQRGHLSRRRILNASVDGTRDPRTLRRTADG